MEVTLIHVSLGISALILAFLVVYLANYMIEESSSDIFGLVGIVFGNWLIFIAGFPLIIIFALFLNIVIKQLKIQAGKLPKSSNTRNEKVIIKEGQKIIMVYGSTEDKHLQRIESFQNTCLNVCVFLNLLILSQIIAFLIVKII